MDRIGLVHSNTPVIVNLLFGNYYKATLGARRIYERFVEEKFYEQTELFWR